MKRAAHLGMALLASAVVVDIVTDGPTGSAWATEGPTATVLAELFTSQGCSSCPPADLLASQLAREPGVVVVTRPVTYWDRLGWKDTLASPVHTALQQSYAARNLPGGGVFTPEMVIDGQYAAVGSDEPEIRRLIRSAAARSKPQIASTRAGGRGIAVAIVGAQSSPNEVVLVALTTKVTVRIGSGENGGRVLGFVNVWRGERVLGAWNGGTTSFQVRAEQLRVALADRYAVVVRRAGGGAVLAAQLLDPL